MPQFPFLLIFNATAIRTKLHIYVSNADAKFIFDLGIDEFEPTFEVGIIGWIPVRGGLRFPFATQVSQCRPESQFLSNTHICPS